MLPHPYDIQCGALVRSYRLAKGITQEALAEAVGVTFQQVQKYETGTNRISVSRIRQIAEFMGVPVSVLIGTTEPAVPPVAIRYARELREVWADVSARVDALLATLA